MKTLYSSVFFIDTDGLSVPTTSGQSGHLEQLTSKTSRQHKGKGKSTFSLPAAASKPKQKKEAVMVKAHTMKRKSSILAECKPRVEEVDSRQRLLRESDQPEPKFSP